MGLSTLLALGAHEGAMAPLPRPPPLQQLQESPRLRAAPAGSGGLFAPAPRGGGGGAAYAGAGVGCCSGLDPTQFSSEVEARAVSNARPPYAASTQREVDEALSRYQAEPNPNPNPNPNPTRTRTLTLTLTLTRYQAALTRTAKAASGSSLTAAQRPSMTDSSQGYPASLSRAGRGDADLNAPAHRRT